MNRAVFGTAIKIDNKSDCFCSRFLYVIEFLKNEGQSISAVKSTYHW